MHAVVAHDARARFAVVGSNRLDGLEQLGRSWRSCLADGTSRVVCCYSSRKQIGSHEGYADLVGLVGFVVVMLPPYFVASTLLVAAIKITLVLAWVREANVQRPASTTSSTRRDKNAVQARIESVRGTDVKAGKASVA